MARPSQGPRPRERDMPDESLSQVDLSKEEVDRLIAEVMRYMLFKNYQQVGVPVKREELVQLITKTYRLRNLPNTVIAEAQKKFKALFGFDMREIIRTRHSKTAKGHNSSQAPTDVKCYILKSTLPGDLRVKFVESRESSIAAGLTLAVIAIVSLCGEKVPEATLWLHLGRLGIKQDDVRHPIFGDIKSCFESLIKQRYISREKVSTADGDSFVYELAEKALDEAVKSKLNEFIAKMVQKDGVSLMTPMTPSGF